MEQVDPFGVTVELLNEIEAESLASQPRPCPSSGRQDDVLGVPVRCCRVIPKSNPTVASMGQACDWNRRECYSPRVHSRRDRACYAQ